jgi:hypothetical protein
LRSSEGSGSSASGASNNRVNRVRVGHFKR